MSRLAACLLPLALAPALAAAPTYAPVEVPFGIHGPTFSHNFGRESYWPEAQALFDAFHQAGIDWARMDLWWAMVEPQPGTWQWDWFDRALQDYADNGVNLMVILSYGAAWQNGEGPRDEETRQAFGRYVFETVRRYRHIVHEWEVWNEPNILPFWAPQPNVADYAALLRVAYEQAKAADPNCVIVGGAMAGADFPFVEGIFDNGAGDAFDVLSYHSYGNRPTRAALEGEVHGLREILDAHGRGDAPIWLSEHGIFTGPGGVSERDQARDIVRSALWRYSAGADRCVYLSMRDWPGATEDTTGGRDFWGFLDARGQPKESFHALRTMADAIRNRPFAGEVHLGEGIEAFLFGGVHDNALALWADGEPRDLTLDAGVAHLLTRTLLGETQVLSADDRTYTMSLTSDPLWLNDVGDNLVLLANVETPPLTLARGEAADLEVSLTNSLEHALDIELSAEPPQGLTVAGAPMHVLLGAGAQTSATLTVAAAADAPVAALDLPLRLSAQGPAVPIGGAVHHARVQIAQPFTVSSVSAPALTADGKYPLRFEVANHTGAPVRIAARVISAQVSAEPVEREVSDTAEVEFDIPLSQIASGVPVEASVEFALARSYACTLGRSLRLFPIPRLSHAVTVDGDLSEWTGAPTLPPDQFTEVDFNPNLNGGAEDIGARGWMAWSDEGLYLALAIHDDVIDLPTDRMIWDHDGLQVAFDPRHDARTGENYNYDDIEVEIGRLTDGSTLVFAGQYPPGRIEDIVPRESQVTVTVGAHEISYEIFFPKAVLDPMAFAPGSLFGFNMIENDDDGAGREGWLELAPGIGWGKAPAQFPTGVMMP